MNEGGKQLRCAIYTRKSTEEGLEQGFNTLQAQREAAEAYIQSQRQAGWSAMQEHFDDGGFTGASLDRPALKRLLAQVEARAIDCVLVYKVDRLSRSLLDFARLMELFDRNSVTFVSVTQDFNTTSSLGRLTLHILLSFAQFEREIISERTRDKLSAARRKGKWIGGIPVLGYDIDPRGGRLIINPAEAATVRDIYQIFSDLGTLEQTSKELQSRGILSKSWTTKDGRYHGAKPLSKSTLRLLLSNVLYTGCVSHKGTTYPGEHHGIIDKALWQIVNDKLDGNSKHLRGHKHYREPGLLEGLLHCGVCNCRMVRTHTTRKGQRHTYYRCDQGREKHGNKCSQKPVRAAGIENPLVAHLQSTVGGDLSGPIVQRVLERVIYDGSTQCAAVWFRDGSRSQIRVPELHRPGLGSGHTVTQRVPRVTRLLALAIKLERAVREGSVEKHRDLAEVGQISRPRMSQIMNLTNLAPKIQEELLFLPATRTGPDVITERDLRAIVKVVDWEWQMKLFRQVMDSAGA